MMAGHTESPEERRERLNDNQRRWQLKHPNYDKEYKAKHRTVRLQKKREYHIKVKFGISLEDYEKILLAQDGRCAVCNREAKAFTRKLAVDHCHVTGKIRGLLCFGCNSSLGKFGDDLKLLEAAMTYLRRQNQ